MDYRLRRIGCVELVIGPMFGGKTAELVRRIDRAAYAGLPSVIVRWANDNRYTTENVVVSHSAIRQGSRPATATQASVRIVSATRLGDVKCDEQTIGIDEGQFFPDLVECCEKWAREGRRVIVAALDGDFSRKPFGQVCDLVPLCESVEKMLGVCMLCRERASVFSQRLSASTETIEIGARESYRSVCRVCYYA